MTGLAFAADPAPSSASGGIVSMIPLIIMLLVIFFLLKKFTKNKKVIYNQNSTSVRDIKSSVRQDVKGLNFAKLLIIFGAIGLLIAINMDTSVETNYGSRVNNIGLMNDKQNYVIIAGIILVVGVVINISNKKKTASNPLPKISIDNDEYKRCQYCAEKIQYQAKLCRFCNRDQ